MKKYITFFIVWLIYSNLKAQQTSPSNNSSSSSNDVILLITPFDKDTIDELNPIFNWTTTVSSNIQIGDGGPMQILYKFTLVKINQGQVKNEAIQQNQPLYTVYPLQGNMLQYPFSALPLERGNNYAWKVEKFLNGALYNQSEVWEFYIKKLPKPKTRYIKLSKEVDANYFSYKQEDTLFFIFVENYANASLTLAVFDEKHNKVANEIMKITEEKLDGEDVTSGNLTSYGPNKYFLVLSSRVFKKGIYTLEGINNKREKYFLRFKVLN